MNWKLADAKNKFSEVVNLAILKEPQRVTRRNDSVIILREDVYDKLIGKRESFKNYLTKKIHLENLNLERDPSAIREIGF